MLSIIHKNSISLGLISVLFFIFSLNFEYSNNITFTINNFIINSIFAILSLFQQSKKIGSTTVYYLIIFFMIFHNLFFYYIYFINNFHIPNNDLYTSFIDYNAFNYVLVSNFLFYFLILATLKLINLEKKNFKFEFSKFYVSINTLVVTLIFLLILNSINTYFLEIKVFKFIFNDTISLIIIIILLSYFKKINFNSFSSILSLLILISAYLFIQVSLFQNNISNISRGFIFVFITTYMSFNLINKISHRSLNFYIIIYLFIVFFTSNYFVKNYIEYFHLISEIQINRNISIIYLSIKNQLINYDSFNYIFKVLKDILPFIGEQRGYVSLIVNLFPYFNLEPNNTFFNFGVISEGILLFGLIGVSVIAVLSAFIIYFINYFFYKFKDRYFFVIFFCHFAPQIYWLYRGGMSLFIRKLYYFSFIYFFLFLIISFFNLFFSNRKLK